MIIKFLAISLIEESCFMLHRMKEKIQNQDLESWKGLQMEHKLY
jgi:hypothetical protein